MGDTANQVADVLRLVHEDSLSLQETLQMALPFDTDLLESGKGLSLFTLKNAALLSYIHHLVLLVSRRLRGIPLDANPESTGSQIVRNLIELRLVLEKIRPLESKTRSLVERLTQAADDEKNRVQAGIYEEDEQPIVMSGGIDPLAFRPNIEAFSKGLGKKSSRDDKEEELNKTASTGNSRDRGDGIYRPPRLAPVVYNPETSSRTSKKNQVAPRNAALLSDLSASMSANPYEASSSGVGVQGSGVSASARAKALNRMQAYEEENMTRLTMSKRDAKRRRRDEADVALGGAGLSSKRGRVGAGLEEEFGDLLRNSSDMKSIKRQGALQRSRHSKSGEDSFGEGGGHGERTFERKVRRQKSKGNKRR